MLSRSPIIQMPDVIVKDVRAATSTLEACGPAGILPGNASFFQAYLSTIERNKGTLATLASNVVTLVAGKYLAVAISSARGANSSSTGGHATRTRLYSPSLAAILSSPYVEFEDCFGKPSGQETTICEATFTFASSQTLELQFNTRYGAENLYSGIPNGQFPDIWSELRIWKV